MENIVVGILTGIIIAVAITIKEYFSEKKKNKE